MTPHDKGTLYYVFLPVFSGLLFFTGYLYYRYLKATGFFRFVGRCRMLWRNRKKLYHLEAWALADFVPELPAEQVQGLQETEVVARWLFAEIKTSQLEKELGELHECLPPPAK